MLLPVVLLLLAALAIVVLQQWRPSIGRAWLIAAIAGLATTASLLFLRWRVPLEMTIDWWRTFAELSSPPAFRLDERSWPYAFCLGLLALAFILTESARLEKEARPNNWAVGLALAGLGMLTVMSANPITLIVTWTAVDFVEFLMLMTNNASRRMAAQTVTLFSVRVSGTLLVIFAILLARAQNLPFSLDTIPPGLAVILLLAAGLRLGVLPINVHYTREVYHWRGLGTVMRMIGPATSMVVLGRMPAGAVPPEWKGVILFFAALAALYGAAMWLAADSEINGRPFWLIALAALGVASVANDNPQASIAWGTVLILPGSLLFFFSAQRRTIFFIPLLGILGIVGLPYTPAAAGWLGAAGSAFGFFSTIFALAVLLLIWGYLRHAMLHPRDALYPMDRWVHTIFPAGLLFLVIGQWIVTVFGWPGSLSVGVLTASLPVAFLAVLGIVLVLTFRRSWLVPAAPFNPPPAVAVPGPVELEPEITEVHQPAPVEAVPVARMDEPSRLWLDQFGRRVGGGVSAFFRLNWLYNMIVWLYGVVQNGVQLLTVMFEGDGGILWSLVMLALLISLITVGTQP
jgi:hypothetical protein